MWASENPVDWAGLPACLCCTHRSRRDRGRRMALILGVRACAGEGRKYPDCQVAEPRNSEELGYASFPAFLGSSAARPARRKHLTSALCLPHSPVFPTHPRAFFINVDKEIGEAGVGYAKLKRIGFTKPGSRDQNIFWFLLRSVLLLLCLGLPAAA